MKYAILPFQNNMIFAGMYDAKDLLMEWMIVEYTDAFRYTKNVFPEEGSSMCMGDRILDGYVVAKRVLAYTGDRNPAAALSYIKTNKFYFIFKEGFNFDKYFFEADTDEEALLLFEITEKS